MNQERSGLPRWAWIGVPLAVWLVPYGLRWGDEDLYRRLVPSEYGLIENVTVLALAVSLAASIAVVRRGRSFGHRGLRWAFVLYALGSLYFLGEEMSWGQHYFGWSTPAGLKELNEQGETNLHNIGGWTEALLDQGPRLLLTIAALVGGIGALWLRKRRTAWGPRSLRQWIWPTHETALAGLLAVLARLPRSLAERFGAEDVAWLQVHGGESKECFLALFLALYALSVLRRLRKGEADSLGSQTPSAADRETLSAHARG